MSTYEVIVGNTDAKAEKHASHSFCIVGDSFHIDEHENLFIRKYTEEEKSTNHEHVAAFARGKWASVRLIK